MQILKKIWKIINNSYLCIKYPFLWPRNRFTDLHYNNWDLIRLISHLKKFSSTNITVLYQKRPEHINSWFDMKFNDFRYRLEFGEKLYIINEKGKKYELPKPEGNICWTRERGKDHIIIYHTMEDFKPFIHTVTDINYPLVYKFANMLEWIHKHPLQWIHSIPTYTELDAMEPGWRKAFGKELCDSLKMLINKANLQKYFRIAQIKEKRGTLRIYIDNGTQEIYKLLNTYEDISQNVCLHCGKPTKYVTKGWITYICEDCARDKNCELIEQK